MKFDTNWHTFIEASPWDNQDQWDKSWIIPVELKLYPTNNKNPFEIINAKIVFDKEYNCWDWASPVNDDDFDVDNDHHVYDCGWWRFVKEEM